MSRFIKEHYEDIANLIKGSWPEAVPEDVNEVILFSLANKFADLFAADNPHSCIQCGDKEGVTSICTCACGGHHAFKGGFDREQFLTACGLELVAKGDS